VIKLKVTMDEARATLGQIPDQEIVDIREV